MLHVRPDLAITTLRGNVQTRLDKLAAGDCAASVLAYAGLKRLGLAARASVVLDPDAMVPAAGQGIIGVTVREDDTELRELLAAIEDPEAKAVVHRRTCAADAARRFLPHADRRPRAPATERRAAPHRAGGARRRLVPAEAQPARRRSSDADRIGSELGASLRADSPADIFA